MPQSLTLIYQHVIFSTKSRRPFLRDLEVRSRLHAFLAGICDRQSCPSLQVGGVEDHVHLLFRQRPTTTIADVIRDLKRDSSKWIKTVDEKYVRFSWQSGYAAFSVSANRVAQRGDHRGWPTPGHGMEPPRGFVPSGRPWRCEPPMFVANQTPLGFSWDGGFGG